jgi:CarD family transcriptional regulator
MFIPDQYIIYGSHGLCVVKRIEIKTGISGLDQKFYILQPMGEESSLAIIVKADTAQNLRPLATPELALKSLKFARTGFVDLNNSTWNRRYREYMEKLNTGEIMDVALVYRSLMVLRKNKDLSFGERKMLDQSQRRLTQELSICLNLAVADLTSQLPGNNGTRT